MTLSFRKNILNNIKIWSDYLQSTGQFLDKVFIFLKELDFDVSDLQIDHIGLRIKEKQVVDKLKKEIESEGNVLISSAIVNGREILIYKLTDPIKYLRYQIPCIELPYPSVKHDYSFDGWEHAEFVISSNANTTEALEGEFKKKFPAFNKDKLPKDMYRTEIPKVESEQLPNPTIAFTKYKGLAVKFHPRSIEEVVKSN